MREGRKITGSGHHGTHGRLYKENFGVGTQGTRFRVIVIKDNRRLEGGGLTRRPKELSLKISLHKYLYSPVRPSPLICGRTNTFKDAKKNVWNFEHKKQNAMKTAK